MGNRVLFGSSMDSPLVLRVASLSIGYAPHSTKELLQDMKVIDELRQEVRVQFGDIMIFRMREHKYTGMPDLLHDIDQLLSIQEIDTESMLSTLRNCNPSLQEIDDPFKDMICNGAPMINANLHKKLAELLDQLSRNARDRLRNGATFDQIAGAWMDAIREANRSYDSSAP